MRNGSRVLTARVIRAIVSREFSAKVSLEIDLTI
jgi:hypothetical protein